MVSLENIRVHSRPSACMPLNTGSPSRLLKNGLGFHYKGYVHNQLVARDKVTPSSIVLWHYGYDISDDQLEAKKLRSLNLLRKQIKEFPDDLPTRHHLAMTLTNSWDVQLVMLTVTHSRK